MIVRLIDCSDCGKRHGDQFRCDYDEEEYGIVDERGRVVATASTYAGALLGVRTMLEEGQASVCRIVTLREEAGTLSPPDSSRRATRARP